MVENKIGRGGFYQIRLIRVNKVWVSFYQIRGLAPKIISPQSANEAESSQREMILTGTFCLPFASNLLFC